MFSCDRLFFFFQAEDGIRDWSVTGVQTCALPILAVGLWGGRLLGLWQLARESPHDQRKIRFVRKRPEKAALAPRCQISLQTGAVAPRGGGYSRILKTALLQEVAQSLLGPPAAVQRRFMDTDEERYGDNEIPARAQHSEHVAPGPVGPLQMLEYLIGDDQIEARR